MNLEHLFETQRKLDQRIEKEHPTQQGEDRISKKILALQVELGEAANEWRGFKFWSKNQNPVTTSIRPKFGTNADGSAHQSFRECNPLLEEYVDCLHFILSIGFDLGIESTGLDERLNLNTYKGRSIEDKFLFVIKKSLNLYQNIRDEYGSLQVQYWVYLLEHFIGLGQMLGFTWEDIEAAYYEKNKINFQRQDMKY